MVSWRVIPHLPPYRIMPDADRLLFALSLPANPLRKPENLQVVWGLGTGREPWLPARTAARRNVSQGQDFREVALSEQ